MIVNVKFNLSGDFDEEMSGEELNDLIKVFLEYGAESCAMDVSEVEIVDCNW